MVLTLIIIVTILIVSVKTKTIADDTCLRLYPQTGSWSDNPPYWFPDDCPPTKAFSVDETIDCMKGRTIYAMGNSVPRQMIFGMLELVGGTKVNREGQRDACPKHETFWGDSCHNEFAGVKFRYLFLQFMDGYHYANRSGFPFYNWTAPSQLRGTSTKDIYKNYPDKPTGADVTFWEEDNCINHNTRSCFKKFFEGSTERDILIFNLGGAYCSKHFMESWLISSASAFRAHIAATFKGTVFHFTNAQTLKYFAYQTDCYRKVDDILWQVWYPLSVSDDDNGVTTTTTPPAKALRGANAIDNNNNNDNYDSNVNNQVKTHQHHEQWYTIDQWAINANRNHYYNDHIHYVGPLTHATLYQVLNRVCPNSGHDVTVKKTSSNLQMHLITVSNSQSITESFVVDDAGYLYPITESCVELWGRVNHYPILPMTMNELETMTIRPPISTTANDICQEDVLLRPGSQRQVYQLQQHRLIPLTYNDFISKGLDFANVKVIIDFVYKYYSPRLRKHKTK